MSQNENEILLILAKINAIIFHKSNRGEDKMPIFYISDMHIGHQNVLCHDNRPFTDINHMQAVMTANWNSTVPIATKFISSVTLHGKTLRGLKCSISLMAKSILSSATTISPQKK